MQIGRVRPAGAMLVLCFLALIGVPVSAQTSSLEPEGALAAEAGDRPVLGTGKGSFLFSTWEGPDIPVWTYVPPKIDRAKAPIAIIMHGSNRDADRYRNQWVDEADAGGFVVIAPGFSKADFPKANGYNLGAVFDETGKLRDEQVWTFSAIEAIFDEVVARLGSTQTHYSIYGHSAGSQFVHRFLFLKPEARVKRYLAANAGWYTFADPEIDFPFGLSGLPVGEEALRQALAKDLVLLLGEEDSDPKASLLNTSEGAMRQGPHRFARGQAFFTAAQSYANRRGWAFGWSLRVVKGVGHSNGKMAKRVYDLIR